MPSGSARDIDSARRAPWIRAFAWAVFPGLFMGVAVAVPLSGSLGGWAFLIAPLAITVFVGGLALAFGEGVGALFGFVAHPRGAPVPPDYSKAEALKLRGDLEGAKAALEDEIGRRPDDPRPSLRLARLLRDDLGRPDEALAWFRTARDAPGSSPSASAAIGRETVELLCRTDRIPAALTELARLADVHAGTPVGIWADQERARLKARWMESAES